MIRMSSRGETHSFQKKIRNWWALMFWKMTMSSSAPPMRSRTSLTLITGWVG